MAYNSSTGSVHVGDLLNEDDEDTQVDFGYDSIIFRTNRLPQLTVNNSEVSASGDFIAGGDTTLGSSSDNRTRVTGSFSTSGSILGHQFYPTKHAYNTSATTEKWIPFYNLSETNAPNNATYINQMVVPFSGQLKRVYLRPSGAINGDCTVKLYKASDGDGLVNTDEQGVLIETQVKALPNTVSTTSIYTFTGSNHYSAGEVVGITVHPTANPVEFNIVCLWEYNVYGL